MTKDEALDLALEALEIEDAACRYLKEQTPSQIVDAITAIKQARALDKMADNARELGLDYEPVALDALVKEEMRYYHDGHYIDSSDAKYQLLSFAHRVAKLYTTPPAAQPAPVQEPCSKCQGVGYYDEGHENEDGSMSGGNYVECEKCKSPAAQPASEEDMKVYRAISDNYHKDLATPPAAQRQRVLFPTMLRKMWSGGEVQAWLDENVNKENT